MRSRLVVLVILGVALIFGMLVARRAYLSRDLPRQQYEVRKLKILTYATFVGASGPGSEILSRFEADHDCKVEVISVNDAGLLLERLKIAQESSSVDVLLGLDQLLMGEALERFKWLELNVSAQDWHDHPKKFLNKSFVPFDWSPLSFVYREGTTSVPQTFSDLLKPEHRKQFALQDPRSSSPGLQFFHWVKAVEGSNAGAFFSRFKENVYSISPSWSFSYGLFKKGQARFVFSYLTSLAFHWGVEKDRRYQVVALKEGHPVQVEFAAVPADCRECELAKIFIAELVSPKAQKALMEKNFMFPVLKGIEQGTVFAELPSLKTITTGVGKDLSEWDQVFK